MKVALIGFMGAGKTTVATELAERLSFRVEDVDERILELSSYGSISEIFEKEGEAHFRDLESKVLQSLERESRVVIACGGGSVLRPENVNSLRSGRGTLVYLQAGFETLAARLDGDTTRPLFKDMESARKLFEERRSVYEQVSDLIVDCETLTAKGVAGIIEVLLRSRGEI